MRPFVRFAAAAAAVHAHVSYSSPSCVRVAFDFSLTSSSSPPQATIDMFENEK